MLNEAGIKFMHRTFVNWFFPQIAMFLFQIPNIKYKYKQVNYNPIKQWNINKENIDT